MGLIDVILTVVYGSMTILTSIALVRFVEESRIERNRFVLGMILKVFGSIAFMLIYAFYYKYGGDASAYFEDALWLNRLFFESPLEYVQYCFGNSEMVDIWSNVRSEPQNFAKGSREFFVTVIFSFFSALGIGNYFATTIVFAFFSFFGYWLLYKAFSRKYPEISKWAFVCVFFLPSGIIWGSGLVKENIILALLGVFFYVVLRMDEKRKVEWKFLLVALLTCFLIAKIKLYVIVSLLPAVAFWISARIFVDSYDLVIKRIFKPIIILFAAGVTFFSFQMAAERIEELSLDSFIGKAKAYQDWHYKEGHNTQEEHGRGSSYTLGSYDPTLLGTLKMVPASINVTYFRPYPWEVKSPIVGFVSMESLLVLLFVLYAFSHKEIYTNTRQVFGDSFFFFILIYALIMGFLVGFTSYNFGALDRYKIPNMPFFIFAIFILIHRAKKVRSLKYSS